MDMFPFEIVDAALQLAGAAIAVAFIFQLCRRRIADPLAGFAPPQIGPGIEHAAILLLGYAALQSLFLLLFASRSTGPILPGSDAWHRQVVADSAAKLVVAGAIVALLVWKRDRTEAARAWSLSRLLTASIAGTLVLLAVCLTQSAFCEWVWALVRPDHKPPQHDLLTAYLQSDWGVLGRLQLAATAVIVAPLAEELFFRGLLLPALWRASGMAWLAIVASAGLFAMVHAAVPQTVLPMFTFGVVLGALRIRSGSLLLCAAIHALFNGRTMLLIAVSPEILGPAGG